MYKVFIQLFFFFVFWNCTSNDAIDYEEIALRIFTYDNSKESLISKVDSVTRIIDGGNVKQRLIRGFLYQRLHNTKKAYDDFEYIINTYPKNPLGYIGLAFCDTFDTDFAIINFNKAIALDENISFAYFGRSIYQLYQEKFDDILKDINKAIQLKSTCSIYYFTRGQCYYFMDSTDLAIRDFKKSLSFDNPYPLSPVLLGTIYENRGQYDNAIDAYSQLIQKTSKKRSGHECIGQIYEKTKRYSDAIQEYKYALRFKKNIFETDDEAFYYQIFQNYALLNEKDSAYKYLDLTLKKDSSFIKYLYNNDNIDNIKQTDRFKKIVNKYVKNKP